MYSDGNGFPLAVKPSHLYGSTERMDTAEVLAMIVEQACLYVPDAPVGSFKEKKPKKAFSEEEKVSKEAFSKVKGPKEKLSEVEKVFVASVSPDLVRFK